MARFATTAALYEHLRQPYPAEFFRAVADNLGLTKTHSLIDLGTGPGLLALGFAPYAGRVVGVDPEPAMLAAAREAIVRAGFDITLIAGRAEDLAADVDSFDVVTVGRALHWMDPRALAALFARLVKPDGAVVICASTTAKNGSNAWLDEYNAAREAWSDAALWSEAGKGSKAHRDLPALFAGAGFAVTETIRLETTHRISVTDLARRVLTFSSSSPAALGDRAGAMLADVAARLERYSRDGLITEAVSTVADIARRAKT